MDNRITLWDCKYCRTFSLKATLKRDVKLRPIDIVCSKCNESVDEFKISKDDLSKFVANQHSKELGD